MKDDDKDEEKEKDDTQNSKAKIVQDSQPSISNDVSAAKDSE